MKQRKNVVFHFIEAYLTVIGLDYLIFGYEPAPWESSLNIALFVGVFFLLNYIDKYPIAKEINYFSFLYSLGLVVGDGIYDSGRITYLITPLSNAVYSFIAIYGLWRIGRVLFGLACIALERMHQKLQQQENTTDDRTETKGKTFWKCAGAFFLCWFPAYLCYYPGMVSYDAPIVLYQILGDGGKITRLHPPLHAFLLKAFMALEKHTNLNGLAIYGIAQMLVLAMTFSYVTVFLKKQRVSKALRRVAFIFFACNPVISIFVLEPTKDVLFSAAFVMTIVMMLEAAGNPEEFWKSKQKVGCLLLFMVLSCLLRNNAVYAFVLCLPILLVILKKNRIQISLLFGGTLLFYLIVNGPIYDALGVQSGDKKEMLSVPMMQIASVAYYNGDYLDSDTIAEINQYIPYEQIKENFNPRFADPIKNIFDTVVYEKNEKHFYTLWGKLLLQYPHVYVSSFLNLNLPSWHPGARAVDPIACRTYIETYAISTEYYPMKRASKCPWLLEHFYEKVATFEWFVQKPILSTLFLLSSPLWMILFTICVLGARGFIKNTWFLVPAVMLWFTHLLGPVSNFRYIFPLHVLMVILFIVCVEFDKFFAGEKDND